MAMPAALMLSFWLTGICGWLVAHAIWDQRMAQADQHESELDHLADAMAEVMTRAMGRVADWQSVVAGGQAVLCPGQTTARLPPIDVARETTRLQQGTDSLSRWSGTDRPVWRYLAACDAADLEGDWRAPGAPPWGLVWVADDPDGPPGAAGPRQVVLHVKALRPGGGRSGRTVTLRRLDGQPYPRIVAWRSD